MTQTQMAQGYGLPSTEPLNVLREGSFLGKEGYAAGHGKIILLGEHAVVYGSHAIAAPISLAIQAKVHDVTQGIELVIPRWGVTEQVDSKKLGSKQSSSDAGSFANSVHLILNDLDLSDCPMRIEIYPSLPRALGLGGSAALAVAIIRALSQHYALGLSDPQVSRLAFECEKIAHGSPSGIDNTVATFGQFLLYRKGQHPTESPFKREIKLAHPTKFVIGMSGRESLTAKMVAQVANARAKDPHVYDRKFAEIDNVVLEGTKALEAYDLAVFGELMRRCHGVLNSMCLSTSELEEMIKIAYKNGALGAKLTGGGGGGSMIALCPENTDQVITAIQAAGYQAMEVRIG